MSQSKKTSKKPKDYEELGRMVSAIYETGYLDTKRSLKSSFLKGVVGGLGGVIGATIVVAILLWALSLFNQVPLVDRFVQSIQNTVETKQ
jgi:hypothetical protein